MGALRSRIQAVVPTKLLRVNACPQGHAVEPIRFLSVTASSDATCRQDVDHFVMQPTSALHDSRFDTCGLHAKRHASSQACKRHVRHHVCNANDSTFAPALEEGMGKCSEAVHPPIRSQASQIRSRCKAQKKSQSLELLLRKVSVLECEQISLGDAFILRKSVTFNSASLEHLAAVLKVLKEFLGSGEKACRALAMNPGVLSQRSELLGQMLTVLTDFGMREEVVRKICTIPHLLPRKLEPMRKTLSLLEEIGLTVKARNSIFRSKHRILRVSEVSILHTLDFFTTLGMSWKEILLLLQRQPALLLCSIGLLRKRYIFFRQLGCTVKEFTRATCAGLPMVAIRTYQAKIKFLKDRGFSDRDVLVSISRYPAIFGLARENLKRKLDFLLCEQNYDIADIVRCPLCLAFSLQDRLIPRLKAVKEKGLFKVYSLSTILTMNEPTFQKFGRREKGLWRSG